MTKKELIAKAAEETGLTQKEVAKVIDAVYTASVNAMKAGDKVVLGNFGTLKVAEKPERVCTNPATGAKVVVAAHKAPKLTVAKAFKEEF